MARIKGIDVPDNKCIAISLTYIYGIGRNLGEKIAKDAGIDPAKKTKDLSEDELTKIREQIAKYTVEGDLRREVNMNIKNKMEIGCYQGVYHKRGLPVRGQSTRSNARTRKGRGKTVANKKKV